MLVSFFKRTSWFFACFTLLSFSPLQAVGHAQLSTVQTTGAPASTDSPEDTPTYVLRVTAQEIGVDVVALDKHQHPVRDLNQKDFQIFEVGGQHNTGELKRTSESPQRISAFRMIEPAAAASDRDSSRGNTITSCATRATLRYRISFRPSNQNTVTGFHEIRITTSRPDVTLYYRRKYFVGSTITPADAPQISNLEVSRLLQRACNSLSLPSSIALTATSTPSTLSQGDALGYLLSAQADTLSYLPMPGGKKQLHLEYGICEYNSAGIMNGFFRASTHPSLSPSEYKEIHDHGVLSHMAVPREGTPTMLRFIMVDVSNGNLGAIDVPVSAPEPDTAHHKLPKSATPIHHDSLEVKDLSLRRGDAKVASSSALPVDIGYFGSPIPLPAAMCGDVYVLQPATTQSLPDFWNLDTLGEVHPYSLNAGEELISHGVWSHINCTWIGIDYYGELWITKPGKYQFWLRSDDGARLYIDDRQIINLDGLHLPMSSRKTIVLTAGRHRLHLPYFQGPGTFALAMKVRGPGEKHFKLFDMRDYNKIAAVRVAEK